MGHVITAYSGITPGRVSVNGEIGYRDENFITFAEFIKPFFKSLNLGYPKFYKMDPLSKLGFVTAELVFSQLNINSWDRKRVGIVMANSSSSLDTDIAHQQCISNRAEYFPSPSVFVYTLPNIMIGEICIRHQLKGENAFLIAEKFDAAMLSAYVNELFQQNRIDVCLTGWVELLKDHFESLLMFVEPGGTVATEGKSTINLPFSQETMNELYTIM